MGGKLLIQRDVVINALNEKSIKVDNKRINIAKELDAYKSKEYRKKDIEKIEVNKFTESNNTCKYHVLDCGSGKVPFLDLFKHERVCILNFASSMNPGGGFLTGAKAQEEDLCYNSNLHDILNKHMDFYEYNRKHKENSLYSDGIIYTENVCFFRNKFKNTEPVLVNVITCPAPNRGAALRNGVKESMIETTMSRRLEQIIKVAIHNGNRSLALGAFGCGVFKNDINYVVKETKRLLTEEGYSKYFDNIIFPLLIKDNNYKLFESTFLNG